MRRRFPWKRFWCRREDIVFLGDRGFLPNPDRQDQSHVNPHLRTLEQLEEIRCLALLGEPGAGKSWNLEDEFALLKQRLPNAPILHLDLRSFGSEDRLYRTLFGGEAFRRWTDGTDDLHLYLDSFDECLLRIDSVAALLADEFAKLPLHRLKFRIACRTASWPRLLEDALKLNYGEAHFAAVELVPLTRDDVLQAARLSEIRSPGGFLSRVDELRIAPLASKPITLRMLFEIYKHEGDLPATVLNLYEKGCRILCEEQNGSRRASHRTGSLSADQRVAVAARIAAITQFGNRVAVWTGRAAEGVPEEDVTVSDLTGNLDSSGQMGLTESAVLEALSTALFSARGQERLGWSHRTLAEFLAARYCTTHKFPIQQLRSLLFHPRRKRVVPQMREVASWLAAQNPEVFLEIVRCDPEVLIGAGAPSLTETQRSEAADALLHSCDQGHFLHVKYNLNLGLLRHDQILEQLAVVIADPSRPVATRYFAISIARACEVKGLDDLLVEIATATAEDRQLRTIAAYAVGDLGEQAQRNRLVPLLKSAPADDPNDEIRGAALRAVYPGDFYEDRMWGYLDPPRRALFFGAYSAFLTDTVQRKLNVNNIQAALRWCAQQMPEELGPIPDLEEVIFTLAVEHLDAPDVADLFARAVLERWKSFQALPNRKRTGRSAYSTLLEDAPKRRLFLEAFLPLLTTGTADLIWYPESLLCPADTNWFIDRVENGKSPNPAVEAMLICRLACSWESNVMEQVWWACKTSPAVSAACKGLFDPVSLDSEIAQWERESAAHKARQQAVMALLPFDMRSEVDLRSVERGDVDKWVSVLSHMSVDAANSSRLALRQMKVVELPGWKGASEEMRSRILTAAAAFLRKSVFPTDVCVFPSRKIMNGACAAVNALELLLVSDRTWLERQNADFWARWIPSLIIDGRAAESNEGSAALAFGLAAVSAPEEVIRRLLEQIEFEGAEPAQHVFCGLLIDRAWSLRLGTELLARVDRNDLPPVIQSSILEKLLTHDAPGAKAWAERTLLDERMSDRGFEIAKAMIEVNFGQSWDLLWSLITVNLDFGRKLMEAVSYLHGHEVSFTFNLNDEQLGKLYGWLLEQYPPVDDRHMSGFVGPSDTIQFLRETVLTQLKKRGTFEACDSLSRLELQLPHYRWLRLHFDEAEEWACAVTWEAPTPKQILTVAANHQKRFINGSQQLLDCVMESLSRLQSELHDELASVGDLWNSRDSVWWPKQEEDVSDYVARFLKRDLVDRGIVVNREVQIRRGRRGEMSGQSTDIHVDAIYAEGAVSYGTIKLIIEVKGSWNQGLLSDMERQLRDRYLKNSECRAGLYLVAHFRAGSWAAWDGRAAASAVWQLDELRRRLSEQAIELSSSISLSSLVLDVALDSTKAALERLTSN